MTPSFKKESPFRLLLSCQNLIIQKLSIRLIIELRSTAVVSKFKNNLGAYLINRF